MRTVQRRKGCLATTCVPRPTGLDWKEDGAAGDMAKKVGGVESQGARGVVVEHAKVADSGGSVADAGAGAGEGSSSGKNAPSTLLSVRKTEEIIAHMWAASVQTGVESDGDVCQDLGGFTRIHFVRRFGEELGQTRYEAFEHSVRTHSGKSSRAHWFACLPLGWGLVLEEEAVLRGEAMQRAEALAPRLRKDQTFAVSTETCCRPCSLETASKPG